MINVKHMLTTCAYMLLASAISIDCVLYLYVWRFTRNDDSEYLYRMPPTKQAIDLTAETRPSTLRRWAVRYISNACTYCRDDLPRWDKLKTQLLASGYRIYVISPSISAAYQAGDPELVGVSQEQYVSIEWLKRYQLTVTPTIMLFNDQKELAWSHIGTLRDIDLKTASRVILAK